MKRVELKELSNIINSYLATKTAASLSMMLGESVQHNVFRVLEIDLKDLESITSAFPNQEMCAVYLKGEGDVKVGMLFFLSPGEAKSLAARLLNKDTVDRLDSLERSSISEVGNILLAGSFLNALSSGTGFQVQCSVLGFAVESLAALLEPATLEMADSTDRLIVADAMLRTAKSAMKFHIMIILDPQSARKLLNSNGGIH
jgi:chemotaxis protein CheC